MEIIRERYLSEIRRFYDSNLIKVLTGVRRCGKSIILKQIENELISENFVSYDHIISINFEDMQYDKLRTYSKLNAYILKQIKDQGKYYIFLDEIQHVRQFEKVLSSLKATQNVSIFVTGSNSKLLSGRLATLLVGRCKEFKIMPFTYSEYLEYYRINGIELPDNPLNDYLKYGGMPQRLEYNNGKDITEYLKSIYDGIVNKDICNSKSKINKEAFNIIAKYIINNSTKEFSAQNVVDYYNKYNNANMDRKVIYRYLEKLEEACLISRVHRYDVASKWNLKSIEKQYAVDNGFILACSNTNNVILSHLLENVIYNELIFKGFEVKIGKTYKGEIDFVAMKDSKKCFIQVAYLLLDGTVINREFNAFKSIKDPSPKYVISLDSFDMSRGGITHLNLEDFLLDRKHLFLS
ncbi:MAG: ATP-binding protein [Erysipelotrichaceae bacterium]|nr:ATP-binding protein [Erysipelotrichaceae bacterium]